VDVEIDQVKALLSEQCPDLSGLAVTTLNGGGVDNRAFRIGSDYIARFPRRPDTRDAMAKELKWLGFLREGLSVQIPELVHAGRPSERFSSPWGVTRWIEGETPQDDAHLRGTHSAAFVAKALESLRHIPTQNAPEPGTHNSWRGVDLANREASTIKAIGSLPDVEVREVLLNAWIADSRMKPHDGPLSWIHGDLHAANFLAKDDALVAILDFGCAGLGDPACDLSVAWRFLNKEGRETLRSLLQPSESEWRRGRAWALSISVREIEHYGGEASPLVSIAQRTVDHICDEMAG
jgi:aminoglycoside phosphotransferase (APT) family kinase protein